MRPKHKRWAHVPPRPHLELERRLWMDGIIRVAGVDESGRGAWAGPLIAAAVLLPPGQDDLTQDLIGVTDSKRISPRQRESLFPVITSVALAVGVGRVSPAEVDRDGLLPATRLAMMLAVEDLALPPQYLLIDAVDMGSIVKLPQQAMFFGDSISLSVAAASIIAKVTRDRIMLRIHSRYPEYGFAQHKGYGTVAHRAALQTHNLAPVHRKSFKPIAELTERQATAA